MAFLYVLMSGSKSFGLPRLKQSAPSPRRPAFSNVDGLPHATQIGGCGFEYGFGSTLRGGIEKCVPSYEYGVVFHIRRISGSASSYIERVVSPSGMRKPLNSVVDDPRPVPNSKRPSERWSSIATRSAVRAGWFTGGVMFQIAEPTCSRFVRAAIHGSMISDAEMWEYSSRKWCSTDQTYLKFQASTATARSASRMSRECSAPTGSRSMSEIGTCAWMNRPNSMATGLTSRSSEAANARSFVARRVRRRGGPVSAF